MANPEGNNPETLSHDPERGLASKQDEDENTLTESEDATKESSLICGMKKKTAFVLFVIFFVALAITIPLAVIYGSPPSWKVEKEYKGTNQFGNLLAFSKDASTLAVGRRPHNALASDWVYQVIRLNKNYKKDFFPLPEDDELYPLPQNTRYGSFFDPWYPTGSDLDISGDGSTLVVVGSVALFDYQNLCNNTYISENYTNPGRCNYGRVTVYHVKDDMTTWDRMGAPLEFLEPLESIGSPLVSLSEDGKTLVIGVEGIGVTVYKWDGTAWQQNGNTIQGNTGFGRSVSINDEGTRIAVGGYESDAVEVYEMNSSDDGWKLLGGKIQVDGHSPTKASLSGSGNRIAVSFRNWDGDMNNYIFLSGLLQVYELNKENSWVQVGLNIGAYVTTGASNGSGLSISGDGTTLVNSEYRSDVDGGSRVNVYRYENGDWKERGQELKSVNDYYSALPYHGGRVATGSFESLNDFDHVRVYEFRRGLPL
eukprot:CAMPEP_0185726712 /NCGR_PEP_ID=MMETSP1171-20130828/2597_1 /TAXON_ID=374046 /ORGANISM="Helicotheca tamensis, Strain CCMP826" /LENGTH=480 /DNA_ID=CAMNT_0028395107 /DNA_START=85 /DNA_END=1527 /DNA_ORIENTATION=-